MWDPRSYRVTLCGAVITANVALLPVFCPSINCRGTTIYNADAVELLLSSKMFLCVVFWLRYFYVQLVGNIILLFEIVIIFWHKNQFLQKNLRIVGTASGRVRRKNRALLAFSLSSFSSVCQKPLHIIAFYLHHEVDGSPTRRSRPIWVRCYRHGYITSEKNVLSIPYQDAPLSNLFPLTTCNHWRTCPGHLLEKPQ